MYQCALPLHLFSRWSERVPTTEALTDRNDAVAPPQADTSQRVWLSPNEVRVYLAISATHPEATSINVNNWLEDRSLGLAESTSYDAAVSLETKKLIRTAKTYKNSNIYTPHPSGREPVRSYLKGQIALITALEEYDKFFADWRKEAVENLREMTLERDELKTANEKMTMDEKTRTEWIEKLISERDDLNDKLKKSNEKVSKMETHFKRPMISRFFLGLWEVITNKKKY